MNEGLLKKPDVLKIADQFLGLAEERNVESSLEHIHNALDAYKKSLFHFVIIGEVKKGKSSFINALLGESVLLPVDTDVATSTVYKVMYGDTKKYEVFFNPKIDETDGSQGEPSPSLEITEAEVAAYGTEKGNPGNEKEVECISIHLPHPLLKAGVIIIDTPGLGGLFAEHGDITWRTAPNADAVCLVLDSVTAEASQPEIESLRKFLEKSEKLDTTSPGVFFVQTKIDAVAESQWQAYRERNLDILSESLSVSKAQLNYFPISSVLKADADTESDPAYLEDSGFPQLLDFFNGTLLKEKERYLTRQLLQPISSVTQEVLYPGITREQETLEVLSQMNQEELKDVSREATKIQKEFNVWERETYPQIVQDFNDRVTDLKLSTDHELVNALDPGPNSPIVVSIVGRLREENLKPAVIRASVNELSAECVEGCQNIVRNILEAYQEGITTLTTEMLEALNISVTNTLTGSVGPSDVSVGVQEVSIQLPSRFESLRTIGYGAMFGGFAGHYLTLIPPLAPLSPILLPGIIGISGCLAWRDFVKRSRELTLSAIESQCLNTVRLTRDLARQEFNRLVVKNERAVRDLLRDAKKDMREEIASKNSAANEAIKDLSSRSKESPQKSKALKDKATEVQELLDQVKQMLNT